MHSRNQINTNNISTPKRRRLGTGRVLRSRDGWRENFIANSTPVTQKIATALLETPERCESPALPCNQVEYMHDSGNNSVSSDIPCSPGNADLEDIQNWPSLLSKNARERTTSLDLLADNEISDEMFRSKLELTESRDPTDQFIQDVEDSFEAVNQSIVCNINQQRESLFETKDSFLLDIQTGVVLEENNREQVNQVKSRTVVQSDNSNSFYGLPLIARDLFKTYRNIEKFYDWQEECLNLNAIKERRNLIYALPTSGGKTLVAEVLMLREVLNRRQNALFILPFVAIVQEKIWALSPFAVQLEFLVEEYAAGKGHIPPKKRRKKNSIYIATIEKGLALIRSLIESDRLQEIGLIVVDELHLIGEPGRGGTLETLLTTVIFANKGIQIVGMSATIGNLPDLAAFLRADVFQREFRPVELAEYVKLGDVLHKIVSGPRGIEVIPDRQLAYDYSAAATALDPDRLGGLVAELVPRASCLVFCPTKRNCENVASLLCKLQRREMTSHRAAERAALSEALRAEGASADVVRSVRFGVAYHHAGLAADERGLLEHAFRSGVISVVCCTSTLAAGVNLPAQRVIVRAPYVGTRFLSLAAYRQMAGRAGRAGVCDTGESIIICPPRDWPELRSRLSGGLPPARSVLEAGCAGLLLSGVALGLATHRRALSDLLAATLLAVQTAGSTDMKELCDDVVRSLIESGALAAADERGRGGGDDDDTRLVVSALGRAAIKGCMELGAARQLLAELREAARGLVLLDGLHLLYLVTPHDAAGLRPDYRHYYSLYSNLNEEGLHTAKILGITEVNAIRMMTGKPITNVPESVLRRFYLALMLRDLWRQVPVPAVADKYLVSRGTVQAAMCSAAALASSAVRVCEEVPALWPFRGLLDELAVRLRTCAAPELQQLMELPAVRKARAMQLSRAGYKRLEQLAKASAEELAAAVDHLSRAAAHHIISAARMTLIEKVENLRAEAEDVMEELKF